MSYLQKEVISLFGQVVHHGRLLRDGDSVAVALSGGKDSLSLLWLLNDRRRKVPINFELRVVWIDLGLDQVNGRELAGFCRGLGLELVREEADWTPAELGSCYQCARLRRRRVFEAADRLGCNVVAVGHNQDDLIETFMMNLVFNGRGSTLTAEQDFHRGKFRLIRPLLRLDAARITRFARLLELPVQPTGCPLAETTGRARMRAHLKKLLAEHPKSRRNVYHGLSHLDPSQLPEPLGG